MTLRGGRTHSVRNAEGGLLLPGAHSVRPKDEFGSCHSEPVIDKVSTILLRHHDIILLSQIPNNVRDDRCWRGFSLGFASKVGRLLTSLGNLASTAHPDALNLL